MLTLCCPVCATEFPLEAGVAEADAKRLAALLADVEPPLARAMFGYLRLHKPAKTALRTSRAIKLLGELCDLVESGNVTRAHRTLPATPSMWIAAMEQMVSTRDRMRLPLSGHGYLLEIVMGLADQWQADAEKRQEEDRKRGRQRSSAPAGGSSQVELASHIAYAVQMRDVGGWTEEQEQDYIRQARERLGG